MPTTNPDLALAPKKKTRRRLRVSCVECTRRRQKCDREQPCGLCKTRGVEHLCRWETEPFARPPPARPPGSRTANSAARREAQTSPQSAGSISPSSSQYSAVTRSSSVDQEVKEAAIALAQLSVARQGEYLGAGSLVSALHTLDDPVAPQSPTDKPSSYPFFTSPHTSAVSISFSNSLHALVSDFPNKLRCDAVITGYFEHDNWCIGVPQTLVLTMYSQMWDTIQADSTAINRINVHWVTLLFAIFSLSSTCATEDESRKYFLQALTARRLGEDMLCMFTSLPPATGSEGAEFECLAVALLGKYMIDRGQMTEAWKLLGSALRNAQNAGLHRNPTRNKWKAMSEDERILRCLSWHLCALADRFLSLILGRPVIIRARDCDLPIPKVPSDTLALDGSSNTVIIFQHFMSTLFDAVSEAKDRFLSVHPDLNDASVKFDARMAEWQASVPAYFSCCHPPDASFDHIYPKLHVQRIMLRGFYLSCCMLFHRSLSCAQSPPHSASSSDSAHFESRAWDYNRLASYAVRLLHSQRALSSHMWWQRQICFSVSFIAFEAAVTLSIVLLRDADNTCAETWRMERAEAIDFFEGLRNRDFGDIVSHAVQVLRVLQDARTKRSPKPAPDLEFMKTEDIFESQRPGMPVMTAAPVDMLGHVWPQLEMPISTMPALHPNDTLRTYDRSTEWMTGGTGVPVTAFDLLYSLDR